MKHPSVAATVLVFDVVVVTRNQVDVEKAGVKVIDPFATRGLTFAAKVPITPVRRSPGAVMSRPRPVS